MNYICNTAYDITLNMDYCIPSGSSCDQKVSACEDFTNYINCETQQKTNDCGKPFGCYIQKYLTLETCYDFAKCNNICSKYDTEFPKHEITDSICNDDKGPENSDKRKINKTIIIASSSVIVFVIFVVISFCIIKRRRIISKKKKFEEFQANLHKHLEEEEISETNKDFWELKWENIHLKDEKLGSGAFGEVIKGKLIGKLPQNEKLKSASKGTNASFNVAVKMLHKYSNDKTKDEFANEIKIMKLLNGCNNIVAMFGCITTKQPMCLVLEYCVHRDLLQYVKIRKISMLTNSEQSLNDKDFTIFVWQIARGMNFLTSKGIIHRDLAARNVLIDADKNAKISDFGLCIQNNKGKETFLNVTKNNFLKNESGKFPIKWLAIECLERYEFSFKSDVWSFGILLYEIYSFGTTPFKEIEPEFLLEHLKCGNRLERPEICPPDINTIMENCWEENPSKRPTAEEILEFITKFLENYTEGYGYLTLLKSEKDC